MFLDSWKVGIQTGFTYLGRFQLEVKIIMHRILCEVSESYL